MEVIQNSFKLFNNVMVIEHLQLDDVKTKRLCLQPVIKVVVKNLFAIKELGFK